MILVIITNYKREGEIALNKETLLQKTLSMLSIKPLNILLPNIFLTAISNAPILNAANETSNSGKDIAATIKNVLLIRNRNRFSFHLFSGGKEHSE